MPLGGNHDVFVQREPPGSKQRELARAILAEMDEEPDGEYPDRGDVVDLGLCSLVCVALDACELARLVLKGEL
jgi:hypothetical protein